MFEWVIDMVCYTPEDAKSSIRAFATNNPMLSHFVFCSTADVYGTQLEWIPVCEDHPTRPVGRYGKAKLAAERIFLAHANSVKASVSEAGGEQQHHNRSRFPVTIMRPATVYGEVGSSATLLDPLGRGDGQWVDDMRAGRPVVVPGTEGTLTQFMVRLQSISNAHLAIVIASSCASQPVMCAQHAENAAEAFVAVLGHAQTVGKVYNVCPSDMHSWGDYYRVGMSICCGRKSPIVPIVAAPTDVLISAGAASIAIKDNFSHNRVLTSDRLCRDAPEFRAGGRGGGVRLAVGLRRMIAAMDAGLLPRRGPTGVLKGLPGERTWASALTVVDTLTEMCVGLKLPQPTPLSQLMMTKGLQQAVQRVHRIGFCGTGKQAAVLASTIVNTRLGINRFEIVGVCDTNLACAQRFATKYAGLTDYQDLSASGVVVTTDVAELCAHGELDGIVIATPPSVRLSPITAAANAKVPIFLEKPPAITMDVAKQCLEALRHSWESKPVVDSHHRGEREHQHDDSNIGRSSRPCPCVVGFQLRHAPAVLRLKELAATHAVHAVRTIATVPMYHPSVKAAYSRGGPRECDLLQNATGGALVSQAIHILDAARFVLGSPRVRCSRSLEGGELQMGFQTDSESPSDSNTDSGGNENARSGPAEGDSIVSNQATISSTVQQLYELEGGIFGTHLNHCGTSGWLWELQLVGPDIDVTLSVGIPISSLRGSVDSARIQEVYDERLTPEIATGTIGEPKMLAWLRQFVGMGTSDGQLRAANSLCDYAEAVDSLELALALQLV